MLLLPQDDPRFGIRRSDGAWYIGTVDCAGVFTEDPKVAATFATKRAAGRRCRGLHRADAKGRTFEVVPMEASYGG